MLHFTDTISRISVYIYIRFVSVFARFNTDVVEEVVIKDLETKSLVEVFLRCGQVD